MALVEVMSVQPGSESRMVLQLGVVGGQGRRGAEEGRGDEGWGEFHRDVSFRWAGAALRTPQRPAPARQSRERRPAGHKAAKSRLHRAGAGGSVGRATGREPA